MCNNSTLEQFISLFSHSKSIWRSFAEKYHQELSRPSKYKDCICHLSDFRNICPSDPYIHGVYLRGLLPWRSEAHGFCEIKVSSLIFLRHFALNLRVRKHPHYLNGRLLFLIITQITTAVAFALRGAMVDRFAYRWAFAVSSLFIILQAFPNILSSLKQRMLSSRSLLRFPTLYRLSSLV